MPLLLINPRFFYLKPREQFCLGQQTTSSNWQKAKKQWIELVNVLQRLGFKTQLLEAQKGVNGGVFIKDSGIIISNYLFVSPLNASLNRSFMEYLRKYKKNIETITCPYPFEGASQFKFSHRKQYLWCAYHSLCLQKFMIKNLLCWMAVNRNDKNNLPGK